MAWKRKQWRIAVWVTLGLVLTALPIVIISVKPRFVEFRTFRNHTPTEAARVVKIEADLETLVLASRFFHTDHARWPASLEELLRPPLAPKGRVRQYVSGEPLDPWTDEHYWFHSLPDGTPQYLSLGRDGAPGGEGPDADIVRAP